MSAWAESHLLITEAEIQALSLTSWETPAESKLRDFHCKLKVSRGTEVVLVSLEQTGLKSPPLIFSKGEKQSWQAFFPKAVLSHAHLSNEFYFLMGKQNLRR